MTTHRAPLRPRVEKIRTEYYPEKVKRAKAPCIQSERAVPLTLKDRATRSPVRLDEVVVRRKNAVDVILRQHHPHVVTQKLACQHSCGAFKAVVRKLAITCRKPAVEKRKKKQETRWDEVKKK